MKQRILYLLLYTVTILTLSACQDDNSFGTDFKPAISRYGSSSTNVGSGDLATQIIGSWYYTEESTDKVVVTVIRFNSGGQGTVSEIKAKANNNWSKTEEGFSFTYTISGSHLTMAYFLDGYSETREGIIILNSDGSASVTFLEDGDISTATKNMKRLDGKTVRDIMDELIQNQDNISNFCPDNNHPHQIDLGLSVSWACCNVGASSPEEHGGYYAWGETTEKSKYEWENYKWCNGYSDSMTKYCTDSEYGTVDNLTTLALSDDAARVNMGSPYRMPTIEELTELNDNCTWTWVTINNINGYKVTASNGNSIFLPVAGERSGNGSGVTDDGIYMSSSLYTSTPFQARILSFGNNFHITTGREYRYYGMSVRAVRPATTR